MDGEREGKEERERGRGEREHAGVGCVWELCVWGCM